MDRTVLDFSGQTAGSEGLLVTSDGVTLEDFAVVDVRGDGVKTTGADGVVYRGLRAEWPRGPHRENGAYALYPVSSRNVMIGECVARAASDAGIYVGQSSHIVVRRNTIERNVMG